MVARPFLSGFHGYKNRVGPPSPNHVLDFIPWMWKCWCSDGCSCWQLVIWPLITMATWPWGSNQHQCQVWMCTRVCLYFNAIIHKLTPQTESPLIFSSVSVSADSNISSRSKTPDVHLCDSPAPVTVKLLW